MCPTGFNHINPTDNSLCVPMVMTLIIFLSLAGSLKDVFLDPCYFYYIHCINDLPNASESLTFHQLLTILIIIYCACKNLIDLELKLNHELNAVAEWMKSNPLALSIAKTSFILFPSKKTETL